ncbi:MAG: HD-GYP domain-containing protein [Pirellulaceae bacterium]|nr:HD-GYP domain-containing protein [Pirellulaceae bacterium]
MPRTADSTQPVIARWARWLPPTVLRLVGSCAHSDRVAKLAVRLARELGWSRETLSEIYWAGLLHDVGKLEIDERLLCKPDQLTDKEYDRIKLHPVLGFEMLTGIEPLSAVLPAVLHHHERWDGRGYPEGLAGKDIPELARVIAVADAHDAMTNNRPYRAGLPPETVDRIFLEGEGIFWDPDVVRAYFRVRPAEFPPRTTRVTAS